MPTTSPPVPAEVLAWVDTHKGSREPAHMPDAFDNYSTSRTSDCWGNPPGGIQVGGYRVAVCQPSPRRKGDTPMFLYDWKAANPRPS